jgi:hypothetical protein
MSFSLEIVDDRSIDIVPYFGWKVEEPEVLWNVIVSARRVCRGELIVVRHRVREAGA